MDNHENGGDFMPPKGPMLLKDLGVLNAIVTQREVLDYFEQARDCGVDMMDLRVNMYIYNRYPFDLSTIIPYTQVLSGLIFLFREEFDDQLYRVSQNFKYSEYVQNKALQIDIFNAVFADINNVFNMALNSESAFTYYIYDMDGIIELSSVLYNAFMSSFNAHMNAIIDKNAVKFSIIRDLKNTSNMIGFYESIYEIFEAMRVPFY